MLCLKALKPRVFLEDRWVRGLCSCLQGPKSLCQQGTIDLCSNPPSCWMPNFDSVSSLFVLVKPYFRKLEKKTQASRDEEQRLREDPQGVHPTAIYGPIASDQKNSMFLSRGPLDPLVLPSLFPGAPLFGLGVHGARDLELPPRARRARGLVGARGGRVRAAASRPRTTPSFQRSLIEE